MREITAILLILLAAYSCTSETEVPVPGEICLTFVADETLEAKTALNNDSRNSASWNAGDKVQFIMHTSAGNSDSVSGATVGEDGKATFTPTFTSIPSASEYTFLAYHPASANNAPSGVKPVLETPAIQIPSVITSYATEADLLVSKPVTLSADQVAEANGKPQSIRFTRLVALAKMTITGLDADTESVSSIRLTATGKKLAGKTTVNLADASLPNGYGDVESSDYIEVNLKNCPSFGNNNTAIFTCYPASLAAGENFTVVLKAGEKTFTKEITLSKPLEFTLGQTTEFSVDMSTANVEGGKEEDDGAGYYEVTMSQTDWSGKYLIVYDKGDGTGRVLKGQTSGYNNSTNKGQFNSANAGDVTFDGEGFISGDNPIAGEYVEVEKKGSDTGIYSIKATAYDTDPSGKYTVARVAYLFCKTGNNGGLHNVRDLGDSGYLDCKFEWDGDGIKITSSDDFGKKLQYRTSKAYFAFGGSNEDIKIFKYYDNKADVPVQSTGKFINPIGSTPDPWIYRHDGKYYLCKSSGDGIAISSSEKLSSLKSTKRVWYKPAAETGLWNSYNLWAPELYYIDGKWYIYYTAGTQGTYLNQRSGVLRAKTSDPMGEWEDLGMLYTGDEYKENIVPTAENTAYAIDLATFEHNGQRYAVWSGLPDKTVDGNQCIYIAKMSNPYTISSNRVKLSCADKTWEMKASSRINEGPAILKRNGKIFIVYSANGSWTKHYTLGYLMIDDSKDLMTASNWTKSANEAFYRCDDTVNPEMGVNGVGHCCFTTSPDGTEDWIVYHAKNYNDNTNSGRSTYIKKFTWNNDGTPNFGTPPGYNEEMDCPSGE